MELNDWKISLKILKYGEIATVAMVDRGAYAESEEDVTDQAVGSVPAGSKKGAEILKSLAMADKKENEDLTVVDRIDIDVALEQADFERFIDQLQAEKHIIFVECLYLGTTEIKGFLNTLKNRDVLGTSKLILLDLPQLEYMMLKDSLAGVVDL